MTERKPPNWKPHHHINKYPSTDKIYIPIINETKTKTIQMSMTTAEAISFAENILITCKDVVRIQEARVGRK